MAEETYFSDGNVKVTQSNFISGNKIYPLDKIESFNFKEIPPKRLLALIFFLLGLSLLWEEGRLFALGGILVILGMITGIYIRVKYAVILKLAEGEKIALVTDDSTYIQLVLDALDSATLNQRKQATHHASKEETDSAESNYISRIPRTLTE